jgi:hypothetical protein
MHSFLFSTIYYLSLVADNYRALFIGGDNLRKKILPVFLSIIILFGSTVMQVKRAEAAAWLGILPVAYAGAAAYVLGAVAVGSIAVGLGLEYGDEINQHASEVWKKTNQAVKDTWKITMDAANGTGNFIVNLTDDMKSAYATARNALVGTVVTSAIKKMVAKDIPTGTSKTVSDIYGTSATVTTSYPDISRTHRFDPYGSDTLTLTLNSGFVFAVVVDGNLNFFKTAQFLAHQSSGALYISGLDKVSPSGAPLAGTLPDFFKASMGSESSAMILGNYMTMKVENFLDFVNDYRASAMNTSDVSVIPLSAMQNFSDKFIKAKADAAAKVTVSVPITTPNARTGITSPTVNTDTKTVTKPVSVPLTPDGTLLKNPDGTVHTGDVTWTFPVPQVGTVAGAPTMTVPITGVGVVELDTGLAVPTSPPVDPPPNTSEPGRIDWSKLKMTAGTLTTVFPFSIPWDVGKLFSVLNVPPKTPVFNIDTGTTIKLGGKNIPVNFDFDINFSFLDSIAAIVRWGFILIFDISIIMALRRLTPD